MKKLILFVSFFLIAFSAFTQTPKKTLYGSFVFEHQVFQYQYKRDGNIHTLKLSTLTQPNPIADLDTGKLSQTELFLNAVTSIDSSRKARETSEFLKKANDGILDTIALLPNYITELKNIQNKKSTWQEHYKNIDRFLTIFDQYKIENAFADVLTKDIYSVTELLSMYKSFLQNATEPQVSNEIPFPEFREKEFKEIFRSELGDLYLKNNTTFERLSEDVDNKALEIMYEIKARAEFQEDEPLTAYINLKRKFIDINFEVTYRKPDKKEITLKKDSNGKIVSSILSNNIITSPEKMDTGHLFIPVRFEIKNVIIEFEDGGIKNIFADLLPIVNEYAQLYGNNTIRFRNNIPISITGKFDPDKFKEMAIYSGNTLELMNILYEEAKRKEPGSLFIKSDFINSKSYNAYFILSNILDYKVVSETDNEDYSPTNCKVELSEPNSMVELKKEKRSRILTARAYTDFRGLSDNEPNGLVQIEVSKRINMLTGKRQLNSRGMYIGGGSYIEPRFTLSKIEENNRYLYLDSFDLDKTKSFSDSTNHFTLNPLKVIQYQQWSFGMDINLVKYNLHNRKLNLQLNGSFTYGSTPVADSLKITQGAIAQQQSRNVTKVNTTSYGLGVMCEIKPDSRYGLSFGYDLRWIDVSNKRFEYSNLFTSTFNVIWFNGFFKINDDSKLFWRFKRNWLSENGKYNFYQIQLGYELDIFKASN